MTDTVQLALIAGVVSLVGSIPATIAALAAYRQGIRNGAKTDRVQEKVDGNFSDLKLEITALKTDKAVLTERLLTTSPSKEPDAR